MSGTTTVALTNFTFVSGGLTDGNSYSGNIDLQVGSTIPEPGTLALLAAGLIGFAVAKRRFGVAPR